MASTNEAGWTWIQHVVNGSRPPAKEVIYKAEYQWSHWIGWPLLGMEHLKADPKDVAAELLWGHITADARKAYRAALDPAMSAHYERVKTPPSAYAPPGNVEQSRLQALEEAKDAVDWERFFPRPAQFHVYFDADRAHGWLA